MLLLPAFITSLKADTITRQHDELNRIKSQSSSGGTAEVITFDKNTNLTSLAPTGSAPTPPAAPTGLAATNLQPNAATFTWTDNASNETGYLLERRIEPAGAWQTFSLAANTITHPDTALAPATLYRLRLTAQNASGSSTPIEITFTTPNGATLPATLSYSATGGSNTYDLAAGVSWSVSSTQPWLTAAINPNGSAFSLIITAPANPDNVARTGIITVTGGTGPVTITVTQAANTSGNAVVTGVTATDGTQLHQITVTWQALAGVSGYAVWRSTTNDPATATALPGGTNGLIYPDTAITDGTVYYYWVLPWLGGSSYGPFGVGDSGYGKVPPPSVVSIDAGFGVNGKVPLPPGQSSVKQLVIQADGKIVTIGSSVAARYEANGALDPTFGSGGLVTLPFAGNSVLLQPNGKIVVVGTLNGTLAQVAAVRLNADGTLDTTFNGTGMFAASITNRHSYGNSAALQPNGGIVIVGDINMGSQGDLLLVRLTTNGTLDPSLNGTGYQITAVGSSNEFGTAVTVQTDGKIIAAGLTYVGGYTMLVLRYHSGGSLDGSFGSGGVVTLDFLAGTDSPLAVNLDSQARILVSGKSEDGVRAHMAFARLLSSGQLDSSFNGGGKFTTRFDPPGVTGGNCSVAGAALQLDGHIVAVGGAHTSQMVTRFSQDGQIDETFDEDGVIFDSVGGQCVGIQADSSIVAGGYNGLVRYLMTPAPRIVTQPTGGVINSGDSFALSASATGTPAPTLQWYRGQSGDTSQPIAEATSSFLTTGPLTSTTSYWLRATNSLGFVNSAAATVEVLILPEIVVTDQTAIPAAELTDDQGGVNLGSLRVGTSATRTFSIHNSGNAPLSGLVVTVDGQSASAVVITQPTATSLPPAETTTFSIEFTPTALGPITATLHIASNDSDENPFEIMLACSGLMGQENVTLTQSSTQPFPISGAIVADGYSASLRVLNLTVNFAPNLAPRTGLILTLVRNTNARPITGTYENLPQGALINVPFEGRNYPFVINYFGGNGNDIELHWAVTKLFAWGANNTGQLGDGTTTTRTTPVEVNTASITPTAHWIMVSSGANHSLALAADGRIFAWGYNGSGSLGNGTTTSSNSLVPVNQTGVLSGKHVVAIAAGQDHSLALTSDGKAYAWGQGLSGRLGDGFLVNRSLPVAVDTSGVLNGKTVTAVAASNTHSLVLTSEGKMYAWGLGSNGRLGNGLTTTSAVPVAVDSSSALSGKSVVGIAAGAAHNLAITSDGRLVAWGLNATGQLGDGTTTTRSIPVTVAEYGTSEVNMAGGSNFSLLVKTVNGVVFAWGANNSGQIGDGSTTNRLTTQSGPSLNLAQYNRRVAAGASHAYSLAFDASQNKDGRIWAWGSNSSGQLGSGGTTAALEPVYLEHTALLTNRPIMALAKGSAALHSLAIVGDVAPTVADWRQNYFGSTANSGDGADLNDYDKDGLVNLIEYALNLNPTLASNALMTPDVGNAGLPFARIVGPTENRRLELQFVRRKSDTSLTYTAEFSSTLNTTSPGAWSASAATPTIVPINADWERVIIEDANGMGQGQRFVRVRITITP